MYVQNHESILPSELLTVSLFSLRGVPPLTFLEDVMCVLKIFFTHCLIGPPHRHLRGMARDYHPYFTCGHLRDKVMWQMIRFTPRPHKHVTLWHVT